MNGWPSWLRPRLTRTRVALAFAIAIAADVAQLVLGPLGWFWPDQMIDAGAAIATMAAIGVHPLLLPTFIIEFLPMADMLPTWTACVGAVVALRRKDLSTPPEPPRNLPDVDVRPSR